VMDAAAALRVRQPTMAEVVKDLVRKHWVTKRVRSWTPVPCVCRSVGGGPRSPSKASSGSANWRPRGSRSLITGLCAPPCPSTRRPASW
jgi:hypothetical protein